MGKRTKATPEIEERVRLAMQQEERPDVIAANKARGRQVFAEVEERQREFADVVTALKEARERRGLSLQDICDKTGITRASLSLMENGKGNPTMTTLRRVAEAIGVEILVTVKG